MIPLNDIPIIEEGDDIADIVCKSISIRDEDIIIIASTIIAKSEGEFFSLENIKPGNKAIKIANRCNMKPELVQAILDRSNECLIEAPFILVEHKNGSICVNAGVDDSNVKSGLYLDLPKDSDRSAREISRRITELTSHNVSVIITDTNGRAFRNGQIAVAVGIANIEPIRDWVGEKDLFGNELQITQEAIADELAAAANLLMGEGNGGTPVIIIRGMNLFSNKKCSVKELYRDNEQDIIRKGLNALKNNS